MADNAANQNLNQNYRNNNRERFLRIARQHAPCFAVFNSENQDNGPSAPQSKLKWVPTRPQDFAARNVAPSLFDLCADVFSKYGEYIVSLEGIPDEAKNKISSSLCASRKMTPQLLQLFITGCPTQICVPDCSLIAEEDLTKLIAQCSTADLQVLQLEMCGRSVSDRLLKAFAFPCLTRLSLRGAYRISDAGVKAIVQAAPLLRSIDLSQCPLLSEASIDTLSKCLEPGIKELRLEENQQLEALKILHAITRMHKLEVLSVARILSVTDGFVTTVAAYVCWSLKEISLADCCNLTDGALESLGAVCGGLNILILDNLHLLTDKALAYLATGCRSLKTLSLKRCHFSDKGVAAFISAAGSKLSVLSLNNVKQVENHTVLVLVSTASNSLTRLDVSWCRKLTDEALGRLADSCPLLQELFLFGCTQVTDKFLKGHSNSLLKVNGVFNW